MRKNSKLIGLCIMATGITVFLSCFLPTIFLVCVQALLLVVIGFLYITM